MAKPDETRQLLESLAAQLYSRSSERVAGDRRSYLLAQDGQFLGEISSDKFTQESISNRYGPFGSPYSPTSILNKYGSYGSPYGQHSPFNPYSTTPPKLFIDGHEIGVVTANKNVPNGIPVGSFMDTLERDPGGLGSGQISVDVLRSGRYLATSYLEGQDGTYLGSLNPNDLDVESIFSQFGTYGSMFSPTSIFNNFSLYGSTFSAFSAFNPLAIQPPKVILNGETVGFLTKNKNISPHIDPDTVIDWASKNVEHTI